MERDKGGRIMVVDDDEHLLSAIGQTLRFARHEADLFGTSLTALESFDPASHLVMVADIRMPVMDGMELLKRIRQRDPELPVILITGHGDIALAVEAMKMGAYDFLEKPVDDDVLLAAIGRAMQQRRLVLENRRLQEQLEHQGNMSYYRGMIGCHPLMNRLYDVIEKVAKEKDPVLICGETGTGKELVARAIHEVAENGGMFLPINMAAMPGEIMESELFGHERGAFTGAVRDAIGKFEYVGEGTLFLDEICSMDLVLQAKLLRVLEERQFTRVGSNRPQPLRARVISATNRDLLDEVAAGRFREDLYYRLNMLQIDIPPLRLRKEDIPLLVEFFRKEYSRESGRQLPDLSSGQLRELQEESWPGNIRELRNKVRRMCVFGEHKRPGNGEADEDSSAAQLPLGKYMAEQEKDYLIRILREHKGNISSASKSIGLSRKGLYDNMKRYGLDMDKIRSTS